MRSSIILAVLCAAMKGCYGLDNGVALTPPRGFSTWNAFPVHSIDEATSRRYMQGLIKSGLSKLNYTYFVVDEPCFTGRDADGVLLENKKTWPNGLKAFGAELRSHGMALGVYTCVGPKTCGGCIASQGHEDQDVKTFAEWGVEYLKVDSCSRNCTADPPLGPQNESTCGRELWTRYTTAIARYPTLKGKQMVYSVIGNLAPGRGNPVWKWAAETRPFGIGNSWRTNIDIQGGFSSVKSIIDCQRRLSGNGSWCETGPPTSGTVDPPGYPCPAPNCAGKECPGPEFYAGPGHWNDMDMLIVGTKTNLAPPFCANCTCSGRDPETNKPVCSGCSGCARPKLWSELSVAQCRAHMSMWTILKSPLLASADLLTVSQPIIDVLANTEVLAVSDDPLGKEGLRLGDSGRQDKSVGEIYVAPMQGGKFAVVMFARDKDAAMTLEETDLHALMGRNGAGQGGGWKVRDLWAHSDNGTLAAGGKLTADVPGGDAVMLILTPD